MIFGGWRGSLFGEDKENKQEKGIPQAHGRKGGRTDWNDDGPAAASRGLGQSDGVWDH
jgi:hypothetical protein